MVKETKRIFKVGTNVGGFLAKTATKSLLGIPNKNIPEEKEIVESIVDSGIQTAEKSLDNLVHKAVVRSAEGSSLIDFSQLHHTANMAGKTMELLSHVDPRAAADAAAVRRSGCGWADELVWCVRCRGH